jgi:hypothetical protein
MVQKTSVLLVVLDNVALAGACRLSLAGLLLLNLAKGSKEIRLSLRVSRHCLQLAKAEYVAEAPYECYFRFFAHVSFEIIWKIKRITILN